MRRRFWVLLVSLALGVAGLWLASPRGFFLDLPGYLAGFRLAGLAAAVALVLGTWTVAALRLQFLTRALGASLRFDQALRTHLVGVFSAVLTPAGGGNSVGIALLLARFGLRPKDAVAVAVMTVVADFVFFGWSVPLATAVLRNRGVHLPIESIGWLVTALAFGALAAAWLLTARIAWTARAVAHLFGLPLLRRFRDRSSAFLASAAEAGDRFNRRPLPWHLTFHVLTALMRGCYFLVLNALLLALGQDLDQLVVVAVQLVTHMLTFAVPTPGGSGYLEFVVTYALGSRRADGALATAVLVWRALQHYLYFVIGPFAAGSAWIPSRTVSGPSDPDPAAGPNDPDVDEASEDRSDPPSGR